MLKCWDCGEVFEEPEVRVSAEVLDIAGEPVRPRYCACPFCGSGEIEEASCCALCGEFAFREELTGGLCGACVEKLKRKTAAFARSLEPEEIRFIRDEWDGVLEI